MAITRRDVTTFDTISGTGNPGDPALPSGTAENDLLIAIVALDISTGVITPSSGWVAIPVQGGSSNPQNTSTGDGRIGMYFKVAVAGEAAPSFTVDAGSGGVYLSGWVGVDPTDPFDVGLVSAPSASATTHDPPAVTVVTAGAMAMTAAVMDETTNDPFSSGPTGWTLEGNGAGSNQVIIAFATLDVPVSGVVDPGVWTVGAGGADEAALMTVALKAAGGGGVPIAQPYVVMIGN